MFWYYEGFTILVGIQKPWQCSYVWQLLKPLILIPSYSHFQDLSQCNPIRTLYNYTLTYWIRVSTLMSSGHTTEDTGRWGS